MSRKRTAERRSLAGATLVLGAIALLGTAYAAPAQASFLVPTDPSVSGFGDFREGIRPKEPSALHRLFGPPARVRKQPGEYFSTCVLSWSDVGVHAFFSNYPYGPSVNPCTNGYFHSARLTDDRWHTPSGIGPGDSEVAARQQARGRCSQPSCGARRSVILGFHRSACGPELFTGVVANFKRGEVVSLVVHSHICD